MVAIAPTGHTLLRDLGWQNVDTNLSRVCPVSCPVDPMARYTRPGGAYAPSDAAASRRLQDLQWLLEWSYGYRLPQDGRPRLTRRAPSAGALYPIETFVVLQDGGAWRVLYYHFASHCFYLVAGVNAAAVAHRLALAPGREAVLLVSVLWRTLQRYGVRGYRYTLLDAAHVASNFARTATVFRNEVELDPWSTSVELERDLHLGGGEALLLALHCRAGADALPVAVPPVLPELHSARPDVTEQTPLLSPVLQRAVTFHRRTLATFGSRWRTPWEPHDSCASPDDLYSWAVERISAKSFTGDSVDFEPYARMAEAAGRQPALRQYAPQLHVHAVTARVHGAPVGLGPVGREKGVTWALPGQTPAGIMRRLAQACQNQLIVDPCAFAFIVSARKDELEALGHLAYRPLVLNAGFLTAELYREASRCGLGTTSIGGFSDEAVADLLGDPHLMPVVVQIFGVPGQSAEKVDMARIVGTPRA
jgi:nitroreductase